MEICDSESPFSAIRHNRIQLSINSITRLGLPGTRDHGRPRKTWSACVRNDMTGVAYPGVRDNRSTINTKTGYDDDDEAKLCSSIVIFHYPRYFNYNNV